jgi:hypothetical protein
VPFNQQDGDLRSCELLSDGQFTSGRE